jgi:hypothetical protein
MYQQPMYPRGHTARNLTVAAGLIGGGYAVTRYPQYRKPAAILTALVGALSLWATVNSAMNGDPVTGWIIFYLVLFPAGSVALWVWGVKGLARQERGLTPAGIEQTLAGSLRPGLNHGVSGMSSGPSTGAPLGRPAWWATRQPVSHNIVAARVDPAAYYRPARRKAIAQADVWFIGGQQRRIIVETDGVNLRWNVIGDQDLGTGPGYAGRN